MQKENFTSLFQSCIKMKETSSKKNGKSLLVVEGERTKKSPWEDAEETILSERYKLHKVIGEGGYGRVWLAEQPDGKRVALKIVVCGEGREVECHAVERLRRLRHDCESLIKIDRVEDHSQNGFIFYTMPLADAANGGQCVAPEKYKPRTLAHELKMLGHLPVKDCISVAKRVLEALKVLHSNNYMHGDVKPGNVIYLNGSPVLADIGLVAPDGDDPAQTGTEAYMSPDSEKTHASDLYSVGILLYHMSTGNPASNFPSVKRTIKDKLFKKLAHVYRVAGDKVSRKRYVSADSMMRALDYVLNPEAAGKVDDQVAEKSKGRASNKSVSDEMDRFMKYIENLIKVKKREMWSRYESSKSSAGSSEEFKEFVEGLRMRFERRIGYTPRMVKTVCMTSEASMEKNRGNRWKLVNEAMRAGFGDQGMGDILDQMGLALGWDNKMFKVARNLVIGPMELPKHPILDNILKVPKRISFVNKMFRKETTMDRINKAFQALQVGMEEAVRALWPHYGNYLEVSHDR